MRVAIWSYNNGSKAARLLADKLDCNIIKKHGSRFRWRWNWGVINWGAADMANHERTDTCRIVNLPSAVNKARCKTATFRALEAAGVSIPEYTTCRQTALGWLQTGDVVCRATTTGHEGIGLSIVPRGSNDLPTVPLYTKYIPKKAEYRVHVAFGQAIHTQRKVRKHGSTGDSRVRNTANGFVFTSRGLDLPANLESTAVAAVAALGLDFGAVDIVYNERRNQVYVLEINTAPGIEGVTLEKYAEAFRKELRIE